MEKNKNLSYKSAGVDVNAGYKAVNLMKSHINKTHTSAVLSSIGGFGGLFEINKNDYDEPVLVSGTDGVGTKLKLAFEMDKHDTVGIDLVAMCVNDILCQGAKPLFFLDYIATGKLNPEKVEKVVKGISDGCVQSGASLIGGETAEMPGMYTDGEYDLAGFSVGIVDKKKIIDGKSIKQGNALIGLKSSGFHSNGFSLIRKVIDENKLDLNKVYDNFNKSLGEELLTPTSIYVNPILKLLDSISIKGMVHITGGGFYENIPRAIPDGLGVEIESNSWNRPKIFDFIMEKGNISIDEMYNVFNMGIGFILIIDESDIEKSLKILNEDNQIGTKIGKVVLNEGVLIK